MEAQRAQGAAPDPALPLGLSWGQHLGTSGAKVTALSVEKWGHGGTRYDTANSQALLEFGRPLAGSGIS